MISSTYERVPANTSEDVNLRIRRQTEESIRETLSGGPDRIAARLRELDREWDIARAIETEASLMALTGLTLAFAVDRRFLVIPAVVAGALILHAAQGSYPLLPLFRRLGFRAAAEINAERFALKAARGDFEGLEIPVDPVAPRPDPARVFSAVRSV